MLLGKIIIIFLDKWSEVKEARISVIFKINKNSDIKVVFYGGEEILYRKISEVEEGKSYQIVTVLDERGISVFYYDIFLKIFDKDIIVQLNE